MCRSVHVKLSAEEAKTMRKIYGVLVPALASIALILFAAAAFTHQPKQSELVASASAESSR